MTVGPVPRYLLPDSASIDDGDLSIGGVGVRDLAARLGTPLFIYDEQHIVDRCLEAVSAFPDGVAYASKAFLCKAMARLAHDAGMDIDVATGGELFVAIEAGVPARRLVMHGNNKSADEIGMAIEAGIGRLVVDSFDELDRIESLNAGGRPVRILVRLNPGIEAYTHEYLATGVVDSKFGFPMAAGHALAAVDRVKRSSVMDFAGVHAHIGSQVFDTASFSHAVGVLAPFVQEVEADEMSIGGGLGVPYVTGEPSTSIREWGAIVTATALEAGIAARVTAEPGRAIVAGAAVTAYSVGTIKDVPDARTYVAVDGGMSDNPRPVLYGSGYEAFLARATDADRPRSVRIVGKHGESGDFIVKDAHLPSDVVVGDIVCTPVTGA